MSRIGKQPIAIPEKVQYTLNDKEILIKGPKGQLQWTLPQEISLKSQQNELILERRDNSKKARALHGLARSLINNMVKGVSGGFQKTLLIVGTGYKAKLDNKILTLNLGYSHPIDYSIPEGISIDVDKKQTTLIINGIDKQLVGQVAAELRKLRSPDPYKGKGIRHEKEQLKLKVGKKTK
jgi:large subunit ribosomal protein L6